MDGFLDQFDRVGCGEWGMLDSSLRPCFSARVPLEHTSAGGNTMEKRRLVDDAILKYLERTPGSLRIPRR